MQVTRHSLKEIRICFYFYLIDKLQGKIRPGSHLATTKTHELFLKKHAGGTYDPTGCGIYFEKSVTVWIDNNGHILDELADKK